MALTPGSERTESWLRPPVQPHLTAYAFHITNPNAVLAGKKPILEERGPFVYKVCQRFHFIGHLWELRLPIKFNLFISWNVSTLRVDLLQVEA